MWFLLALISALFGGTRRLGEKRLLRHLDAFTLGWSVQLLSLPFCGAALMWSGQYMNPFTLGLHFWIPIVASMVLFYPLNTWLAGKALRHGELSEVLPIQSMGPGFALLFAWYIFGQLPSWGAAVAIALITTGLYILNSPGERLYNPLRLFRGRTHSLYMLASTALIALFVPLDTIAIKASNPYMYAVVSTISAAFVLYVSAWRIHAESLPPRTQWRPLAVLGSMQGIAYVAVVAALSAGPIAYVSAIKSSGVLIGAISGMVVLREPVTLPKIIAFTVIGAGMALLAIAG